MVQELQVTERTSTNQSVERALAVLKAFASDGGPLRASDISKACDLGPSTTSRLLATLAEAAFIERDDAGTYRLGPVPITLAGAALNQSELCRQARPIAYEVSCETGLGVNLAELRDSQVFYLLHFDGRLAPRSYTLIGRHNPLHATGLGKCLVSDLQASDLAQLLEGSLQPYTPYTITDLAAFGEELARVRLRGFATEKEELAFGRGCVAAPIRGRNGSVVAAISISGPLSVISFDERGDELGRMVIEAADRIGTAIGASHVRPMADGVGT